MRTNTVFAALAATTMGCTAILGVRDLYYDENAPGADGGRGDDANGGGGDGAGGDGGTDAPIVCDADLQIDKQHCGRCGHDCGGGECVAGKCQALQIGAIANAPLTHALASGAHVFVSTFISLTTEKGGIWRIAKSGGQPELYVDVRYAGAMVALADKLYFVSEDDPANDAGATGGLYSCPLAGPAPCAPTRIAAADNPRAITLDKTRILYGDRALGMMAYVPPNAPTVFRDGYGAGKTMYVDGNAAFYNVTIFQSQTQKGRTIEVFTDGGFEIRHDYDSKQANAGVLVGSPEAVYVTAYDYLTTNKGVVHRHPRAAGVTPCDYGGSMNQRPHGLAIDDARIYWTNQGDGPEPPYTRGSVATCELAGCCATPEILWTGDGQPRAIALDDRYVYYVTRGNGGIWKVAKP